MGGGENERLKEEEEKIEAKEEDESISERRVLRRSLNHYSFETALLRVQAGTLHGKNNLQCLPQPRDGLSGR